MDTRSELVRLKEYEVNARTYYEKMQHHDSAVCYLKAEQFRTEAERKLGIDDVPEYRNAVIGG